MIHIGINANFQDEWLLWVKFKQKQISIVIHYLSNLRISTVYLMVKY